MSESIVIEGGDRFVATLQGAKRALQHLDHAAAVEALEAEARPRAPRRTGELAGSFGTRVLAGGAELVNTARHAAPVQFGTRHMAARPFMPADPAGTVTPLYLDEVEQIVRTIKGK